MKKEKPMTKTEFLEILNQRELKLKAKKKNESNQLDFIIYGALLAITFIGGFLILRSLILSLIYLIGFVANNPLTLNLSTLSIMAFITILVASIFVIKVGVEISAMFLKEVVRLYKVIEWD